MFVPIPKVPWSIKEVLVTLVLSIVLVQVISWVIIFITQPIFQYELSGNTWLIIVMYVLQNLIIAVILWLFLFRKHRPTWGMLGFRVPQVLPTLGLVFFAYLAYLFASLAFLALQERLGIELPGFSAQAPLIPEFGNTSFGLVTLAITAIFIAPLIEEVLFRGYILSAFATKWNPVIGIVISAFLFSAIHFQWANFFPILLLGLALGWLYVKSGSLWSSIAFHAFNNMMAFIVEFLLRSSS